MKKLMMVALCALAAVVQAASAQAADTQSVFGGHYYIEDNYQTCLSQYMSLLEAGGGSMIKQGLREGDHVTFYAHPDPGMKVKEWGYCFKDAANVRHYENLKKVSSTKTSYAWSAAPALGNGYLAVNFDYIPFEITFDGNGGEGEMQPITGLNIVSNAIRLTSCQFTRTGYEMVGWSNAVYWAAHQAAIADGGTVKGEDFWDDAVTNFDGKLIALWSPKTYTVTIDPNGGTGGSCPDYIESDNQQTLIITPPTKVDYVITSWDVSGYSGDEPTIDGDTLIIPANTSGNLTLTPTWIMSQDKVKQAMWEVRVTAFAKSLVSGGEAISEDDYRTACEYYGITPKTAPTAADFKVVSKDAQVVQEGEVAVKQTELQAAKAEAVSIADGVVSLGVTVNTNGNFTAETKSWAPVELKSENVEVKDGKIVISIPVDSASGFMILQSGDAKVGTGKAD